VIRTALIASGLLLSGCHLFLPSTSCSRSSPMFPGCAATVSGTTVPDTTLAGTDWNLVKLGTNALPQGGQRAPHLLLNATQQRVSGSGGCNRLTGSYTLSGSDGIGLSQMAVTRMACATGMELEQEFLKSLEQVKRWRIDGERLELLDATGTTLASFQSDSPR
jgi:heat shock protein HslJ